MWVAAAAAALRGKNQVLVSAYDWGEKTSPKILSLQEGGATLVLRPREWVFRMPSLPERLLRKVTSTLHLHTEVAEENPFQAVMDFKPQLTLISQGGTYDFLTERGLLDMLRELGTPYYVVCHSYTEAFSLSTQQRQLAVKFFNEARAVFLVARSHVNVLQRQLAARVEHAMVVRNPFNLKELGVIGLPGAGAVHFAVVGHLEIIWKGQDLLFEILSQEKWLARDWVLNVYGSGSNGEYLEALTRFYGIQDRVVFHGYVSDIRKVWAENHLLLMPSRQEVAPIALVEAMLCGRTAVVTDVGGVKEWMQDGENGFVAGAPTAEFYGAALERAWEKRSNWELLGERAYQKALTMIDATPGETLLNKMTHF